MRTQKTTLRLGAFQEFGNLEKNLAKAGKKGWKLVEITDFTMKYQRIAPTTLQYGQLYLKDTTYWEKHLTQEEERAIAFCEETGWHFVGKLSASLLFCCEGEEKVPLETEDRVRLDCVHRVMKQQLPGQIAMVLVMLMVFFMQGSVYFTNRVGFFTNLSWLNVVGLSLLLPCLILPLLGYFHWYFGSKSALQRGEPCLEPMATPWLLPLTRVSCLVMVMGLAYYFQGFRNFGVVTSFAPLLLWSVGCGWAFYRLRGAKITVKQKKARYVALVLVSFLFLHGYVYRHLVVGYLFTDSWVSVGREAPVTLGDVPEYLPEHLPEQLEERIHHSDGLLLRTVQYEAIDQTTGAYLLYVVYQPAFPWVGRVVTEFLLDLPPWEVEAGVVTRLVQDQGDLQVYEMSAPDLGEGEKNLFHYHLLVTPERTVKVQNLQDYPPEVQDYVGERLLHSQW